MKVKELVKKIGGQTHANIIIKRGFEKVSMIYSGILLYATDKELDAISGMNDTVGYFNVVESSIPQGFCDIVIQCRG